MPQIIGWRRDGRPIFPIAGADGVDVTAGSGTKIATDTRTIGGTSQEVQRATLAGGSSIAADDVSVTTTSGSIISARDTRSYVTILASPGNTDDIYVGPSGVDAAAPSGGFRMVAGSSLTLFTTAAIHGDAVSGTQTIYYVEAYD